MIIEWNPDSWANHSNLLIDLMRFYDFYSISPRPPVLRRIDSAAKLPSLVVNLYLRKSANASNITCDQR